MKTLKERFSANCAPAPLPLPCSDFSAHLCEVSEHLCNLLKNLTPANSLAKKEEEEEEEEATN